MKKLRAIVKKQKNPYVPNDPVHFKMNKDNDKHYYVPENPVHFKLIMNKTVNEETSNKPIADISHWSEHNDNSHLGNNAAEVSAKIEKPEESFTKKEIHHIGEYTDHSREINKYLIGMHRNKDKAPISSVEKAIDHLDSATKKPIGHELHLYSGISFNPADQLNAENDHIMHLPAYTSATHSKRTATGFARSKMKDGKNMHILHIHMQPEDHGVHVNHVGCNTGEHETILPRDTKLKVNPTPTVVNSGGENANIWHATVHNE